MKSKVTIEELKEIKPDFSNYFLNVALEVVNAAFEAVSDTFEVSKEDFLKVVASDYGAVYFMGKAYLAAREEEKSEIAVHAFYLFDDLLCKQNHYNIAMKSDNKRIVTKHPLNLAEGWTKKMHVKYAIVTVVGWFNPKASWHVGHGLFTKEEQEIIGIDLSFLD